MDHILRVTFDCVAIILQKPLIDYKPATLTIKKEAVDGVSTSWEQ